MLKAKHFFALVVVAAALVLFAAYSLKEGESIPQSGNAMFPGLLERIPDVVRVDVMSEGRKFVLETVGDGRWTAPERGSFPLDADKVHQLLVGAAALNRIEPKTSKPELYAQLGVEDPTSAEAASIRYTLRTGSGEALADLIVGEGKPAKGDVSATEYFVREPDQAQSWLVKGTLPSGVDTLQDWLASRVANVSAGRTRQVQLTHPDGEVVTARKDAPGGGDFQYVEAPADRTVKDVWRVNDIGRVLADLELDDVRMAGQAGPEFGPDTRKVEMRTFDGLVVNLEVVTVGEDEHLARLTALFDAAQADAGSALESKELKTPEAVKEEVASLNERWKPWVYVIPRYKSDYVNKRQEDLLSDPEPKAEKDAKRSDQGS